MDVFLRRGEFERSISNLRKLIKAKGQKMQVRTLTITEGMLESGKFLLKTHDDRVQFLDPGGASRNITLPAEPDSQDLYFYIFNTADAAEDLTVEDDAPTPNTIVIVSQDEGSFVVCDGASWRGFVGGVT